MGSWLDDVVVYDIEVFSQDWLVVMQPPTGQPEYYTIDNLIDLRRRIQSIPLLCGYNNKHYDQWVLKAIYYYGSNPEMVKQVNDFILTGNQGWDSPLLQGLPNLDPVQFDLMDDLGMGVFLRLKEVEGNLGMSIEESSVPFDIDRPLTIKEMEEVKQYCAHDVAATCRLLQERMTYLHNKVAVGQLGGLHPFQALRMTNPKLTGMYLQARAQSRDDEFEYDFPENLCIKKYTQALDFYQEIDYKKKLEITIAGIPHTLGWGGIHGAAEHCIVESNNDTVIMHIDVTSYYPSLMIQNGYLSRNVPDPNRYTEVFKERVAAKKAGDKATANALKLILNSTYGATKNKYNPLYDPHQCNAVCISGQLYLIDLLEKLEVIPSFRLIQSNTDGLIVQYHPSQDDTVKAAVREWEQRTGFSMGIDPIEKLIQKDVNNYVMRSNGETEVKGGYVSDYDGGTFKHRSLVIVAKALVNYFLDGIPPEETILGCRQPIEFQLIAKAGNTYNAVVWQTQGEDHPVQMVNRVFACTDQRAGTLYKLKTSAGRRDKIANLPTHCMIANGELSEISHTILQNLDWQWYIGLAYKRINDYLGNKPLKKGRKTSMAETKTTTRPTKATTKGINAKLELLRDAMASFAWEKDGLNRHQSYKYITEKQYKQNFQKALQQAGLLFKCEELSHDFLGAVSDKMNLTTVTLKMTLIDPESGESECFQITGAGADSGDKGIYKAYTGALKYFLATNFLVAEDDDPEKDEPETPKYTPPEKREEAKKVLTQQPKENGPATNEQLETIADGMMMLDEAGNKDVLEGVNAYLDENGELTKAQAEELLNIISEALEDEK